MFLQPSYVFRQLPAVFEEYVVPQATCSCILIEDLVCLQTTRSTPNISSYHLRPAPPKKNVPPLLFSSRWIQPLYPIFAVTLVFALRWSLGLFPKKLSKSIWAPPTVGEHREFWLLKTSLIFQVISWDLDVNVLKHITMKILLQIKRYFKFVLWVI